MTTPITMPSYQVTEVTPSAPWLLAWARAANSELRRLRRWSFSGVGAVLLAMFALMATSIAFLGGDTGPNPMGGGADVDSARGLVAGLDMASSLLGIVVLAFWAVAGASDFGSGLIRIIVQAEPRRGALLAGKVLTLVGLTLVGTLIATGVAVGTAIVVAGPAGASTDAWWPDAFATILSGWANLSLAVLVWGIIGLAIAVVTRSATAAIAGGIGYLMVFEGLLGILAEDVTTFLPGSILMAVTSGGTPDMAWGTAVALAIGYAAVAMVIAGLSFMRRDITS
jgi:ABC-type transport system involved in multi-copper enzyme maturation permease subunit